MDELNSAIGFAAVAVAVAEEFRPWLERVQNELFYLGVDLSVRFEDPKPRLRVEAAQVAGLERLATS